MEVFVTIGVFMAGTVTITRSIINVDPFYSNHKADKVIITWQADGSGNPPDPLDINLIGVIRKAYHIPGTIVPTDPYTISFFDPDATTLDATLTVFDNIVTTGGASQQYYPEARVMSGDYRFVVSGNSVPNASATLILYVAWSQ